MQTVEMAAITEDDIEEFSSGKPTPPLSVPRTALLVGVGAAVGGLLRMLASEIWPSIITPTLVEVPIATLMPNLLGCLGLGIVSGLVQTRPSLPRWVQPLLGTGLFAGFTSFSILILQGAAFVGADFMATALLYSVLTILAATGGTLFGLLIGVTVGRRYRRSESLPGRPGPPGVLRALRPVDRLRVWQFVQHPRIAKLLSTRVDGRSRERPGRRTTEDTESETDTTREGPGDES
jgi:CrcB protein